MKKFAALAGPIVVMLMMVPFLAAQRVTAIATPAIGQELIAIACTGSMRVLQTGEITDSRR